MKKQRKNLFLFLMVQLVSVTILTSQQSTEFQKRSELINRWTRVQSYIKGGNIQPHWMKDHNSFWYAEGAPDNTIIYKVDPKANTKTPLFETQRLRDGLASVVGQDLPGKRLPFSQMTFIDENERNIKFKYKDKEYIVNLDNYSIIEAPKELRENEARFQPRMARRLKYRPYHVMELLSPDRLWFATLKDHNLCLRSTEDDQIIQITNDGIEFFDYRVSGANWSPDSHS
jgi:hypothetical protein